MGDPSDTDVQKFVFLSTMAILRYNQIEMSSQNIALHYLHWESKTYNNNWYKNELLFMALFIWDNGGVKHDH